MDGGLQLALCQSAGEFRFYSQMLQHVRSALQRVRHAGESPKQTTVLCVKA